MVRGVLLFSKNCWDIVRSENIGIGCVGGGGASGGGGGACGDSLEFGRLEGVNRRRIVAERGGGGGRCSCTSHLA